MDAITVSSGNVNCYGIWSDSNGGTPVSAFPSDNAVASTPTTSGAVTAAITLTYSTANTLSSYTCEMCNFELGGLV